MDLATILTDISVNGIQTVLFALLLTGLIQLAKYFFNEYKTYRSNRLPILFERIHKIYELMNVILHESPASEVYITKITNGGAIPKIGSELFATIVYEQSSVGAKKPLWQQRVVDPSIVRELVKLAQEKENTIDTENLVQSPLRDALDSNKTTFCQLFELYATDGAYFYLTLSYPKAPPNDSKHREFLRSYVAQISRLIKEDHAQVKKQGI